MFCGYLDKMRVVPAKNHPRERKEKKNVTRLYHTS